MTISAEMMLGCEWEDGFMLAYTWETKILRTIYGYEQRSALFSWPRRTAKYNVKFMSEAESNYFTRVIRNNQGSIFGVPIWGERKSLSAQAPSGQEYVDIVDVDKMNYEVGGYVLIWSEYNDYEIKQITALTTTRISFTGDALSNTWEAGTNVYPMFHGTIEQNVPYTKQTSAYGGASLVFKEAWDASVVHQLGSHTFPTYNSHTVFNKNPNWSNPVSMSFNRMTEALQKWGAQILYTREDESEIGLDAVYMCDGIDECAEMRGLFNGMQGKWDSFWFPSWQRDIVVTGAIAPSDDYIAVQDIDYVNSWASNISVGRYVFLLLPDGTELYRKIIGWPTSTRLNLDSALGATVSAGEVSRILGCFLVPGRFEVDEMEMRYHVPHLAETRLRMQSLFDEDMTT